MPTTLPQAVKPQGPGKPGKPLSARKADGPARSHMAAQRDPPRYFAGLPPFAPPSLIWRSPRSSRTSRDCRKLASCFCGLTAVSLRSAPGFLVGFLGVVFISKTYHPPVRALVLPCPKLGGYCSVSPSAVSGHWPEWKKPTRPRRAPRTGRRGVWRTGTSGNACSARRGAVRRRDRPARPTIGGHGAGGIHRHHWTLPPSCRSTILAKRFPRIAPFQRTSPADVEDQVCVAIGGHFSTSSGKQPSKCLRKLRLGTPPVPFAGKTGCASNEAHQKTSAGERNRYECIDQMESLSHHALGSDSTNGGLRAHP